MGISKTNAMRILDKHHIPYDVKTYPHDNVAVDGMQVATLLQQDPNCVCKTLITISNTKKYFVFVIPVNHELDVKKCAKAIHQKSVEMIPVKDINRVTGYVRGGCSPIGMKKSFTTVLDASCLQHETIMCSGGNIGLQIILPTSALISLLHAQTYDIVK